MRWLGGALAWSEENALPLKNEETGVHRDAAEVNVWQEMECWSGMKPDVTDEGLSEDKAPTHLVKGPGWDLAQPKHPHEDALTRYLQTLTMLIQHGNGGPMAARAAVLLELSHTIHI
ncbi:unnamed protein product [Lota lota]